MENSKYIDVMIQSLEKKLQALDAIIRKNKTQTILLSAEKYDDDAISQNFKEKGELVDSLKLLDDGFENVYERVKKSLDSNRELYRDKVIKMQDLIRKITEKSTLIESQEARNKKLAEKYFDTQDAGVAKARNHYKVTNAYKSAMANGLVTTAQFLDKRK